MESQPSFAVVLRRYLDERGIRLERLARAADVREETIHHWLSGKVKRPYIVENILRVAAALGLSRIETDRLLASAGWPSVAVLSRGATDETRATLLANWQVQVRHNLPAPLSSFVGRDEDIVLVAELLSRSDVRLVTLTGPGGSGKTRLSIEVARQVSDSFPDGVYLVPLAVATEPLHALLTIARALNLREEPGVSPLERVLGWLRQRRVLLLLDNLEQVTELGSDLAAMLSGAPDLTILATSRIPLHVSGEHVWPVAPLSIPGSEQTLRSIASSPAVALFTQRARAANPRFRLTRSNAPAVIDVCARLDGMPLAIELAAARVQQFAPEDLRHSFSSTLDLASEGPRDLPDRQQTLRATIGWSEQLLPGAERRLFARLGVFAGDWSAPAAVAVCQDETLASVEVQAGLERLRAASLVDAVGDGGYRMLETIREYAVERLVADGSYADARQRHAEYFRSRVESSPRYVPRTQYTAWYDMVDAEYDNLRAALDWTMDADPTTAIAVVTALWPYWQEYAQLSEGRHWLSMALAATELTPDSPRAQLLIGAFYLAVMQGDFAEAFAHGAEGLRLAHDAGDHHAVALVLQQFGWLAYARGQIDEARSHLEGSIEHWRVVGVEAGVASCLSDLALFLATAQRRSDAEPFFAEATAIYEREADLVGLARSYTDRGASALLAGDLPTAIPLLQHGVELSRNSGGRLILPAALFYLGTARCLTGDPDAAVPPLTESLRLYEQMGNRLVISLNLLAFAAVAHRKRQLRRSAQLCGAATSLQASTGIVLAPGVQALYEHETGLVRAQLEPREFDLAFADGTRLTTSEAIGLALSPA